MGRWKVWGNVCGIVGLAIILVHVASPSVSAQATTGTIGGTVLDPDGGTLPGVTVSATNVGTGETRLTATSLSGAYTLTALPLGDYSITAELPSFRTMIRDGITLSVGQTLDVDFTLELGALEESITVTAQAPVIETTKVEVTGLLVASDLETLPVLGRNWLDLGMLMPGVSSIVSGARGVASGRGNVRDQSLIVDGIDSRNECCGRVSGQHGMESIAEFKLITNNFSAEYGRSTSYVMTAVTKSGSNAFHGTGFYLSRNDGLNSEDYFLKTVEPIDFYQAGFSIGGPVVEDRVFFFGSWEHQTDQGTGASTTGFPELDSFRVPLRNNQNYYLGKVDVVDPLPGPSNHLSAKYYYFKLEDLNGKSIIGSGRLGGAKTPWSVSDQEAHNWGIVLNNTWATGDWVNEAAFGYSWTDWLYTPKPGIPIEGGWINGNSTEFMPDPGTHIPYLRTPSFQMGTQTNLPQDGLEFKFEFKNNYTRLFEWKGDHEMKIGASVIHGRFDLAWFLNALAGQLTFTSDPTDPFDFSTYPSPTRFVIGLYRPGETASCPDSTPDGGGARTQISNDFLAKLNSCAPYLPDPLDIFAGYIQDSWRLNPSLTLNLGVRYEYEAGPFLTHYLETYKPQLDPQLPHPSSNDGNNVAPRVGFSYRLGSEERTVIRGGGGIFYGSPLLNRSLNKQVSDGWGSFAHDVRNPTEQDCFKAGGYTLEQAITQNPRLLLFGCDQLTFDEVGEGPKAVNYFVPDLEQDKAYQSSLGFAHQLTNDLGIEIDYVYQHTITGGSNDRNLIFDPTIGPSGGPLSPRGSDGRPTGPPIRPDARFTGLRAHDTLTLYSGHSLQMRLNKRFSNNFNFNANYTLAYNADNITGSESSTPDNPFCTRRQNCSDEVGPTINSQRHRLNIYGVYVLPFDFEVSGIMIAYSGIAYDHRRSGDPWNLGRGSSRAFYGPTGNILLTDRNSNRGETFVKLDVRLTKWFNVGGEHDIGLIFEGFNIMNKANFGAYGSNEDSRVYQDPLRNPNAFFAARQWQFGLRYRF